jgi:hypothetical protein
LRSDTNKHAAGTSDYRWRKGENGSKVRLVGKEKTRSGYFEFTASLGHGLAMHCSTPVPYLWLARHCLHIVKEVCILFTFGTQHFTFHAFHSSQCGLGQNRHLSNLSNHELG